MKYLVASFILFFCTLQTFGQQDYFVYLQTDNNQAFYLRINNTVYSSTASGYLILSKLPDSTANVTIGFAKMVFPEQQFNIPVNHKDAGYLLKNFGEKGWGLFNLQTMAVVMNSNAAQEKKSPEINGSRKNDAFSLLLANAVNDTAVLYVVNKPKKMLPPEAGTTEKKKDSADTAITASEQHDSTALVTKKPAATDSNLSAKNTSKAANDSAVTARVKPLTAKETAAIKKAIADSIAIAKNNAVKNDKKAAAQAAKDSIAHHTSSKPVLPTGVAVTGTPAHKDTIIMMNSSGEQAPKQLTEKEAKLAAARKKDSLQLAKKQEARNNAAAKKQAAAGIAATDTLKKDTLLSKTSTRKDTAAALVKTELPAVVPEKKETSAVEPPPKRSKPLIYKAADLLTDTAYVAVFVDESKDKFDTIRISIALNEAEAQKKEQIIVKESPRREKVVAAKKVIDSLNNPADKTGDTARENAEKEKAANTKAPQTGVAPVKPDSLPASSQQTIVKKDPPATVIADTITAAKSAATSAFPNSDCKETALDADIDKLRIKMLLVTSDEEKIALAKKVFRQKCFITNQVKALSELFKTDEGKYKWFDAVYAFVADSGNFSKLSELLKDDYYLNRFKAMLRN